MPTSREIRIRIDDGSEVSGILDRPAAARAVLVMGHGAGAGMRHPFMEGAASELGRRGLATLRYQFPYMEAGRRRPDTATVAMAAARAALAWARAAAGDLPLFAGGKSFGGRMTSRAVAETPWPGLRGLIFLGFPLHPAGRPSNERAAHLQHVGVPMLFVQGTRDDLASMDRLAPVILELGRRATLHVVEGGDHSFRLLKRDGRTADQVMAEIGGAVDGWVRERLAPAAGPAAGGDLPQDSSATAR
jgi:uncharacterized protein